MELSALLFPGEYTSSYSPKGIHISGISYRSEEIERGCLFVCLRGTRYDAHTLLRAAGAGGAAAALVEEGAEYSAPPDLPIFTVPSTRRMLAHLYYRFCSRPASGMHLIAVTGTNGKTSTSTMIYNLLCACGHKAALIGTVYPLSIGIIDNE